MIHCVSIFLDCYRFDWITYHVIVFLIYVYIYNIYTMLYGVVFSPHPQNIDQSIQGRNMKSNWTPATWISNLSDPYKNHKKKHQRTIKQAIYHDLPPKKWDFQTLCLFCLIFIPCGMSPPWLRVHGPPRRRPRASRAKAHGSRASVGRRANTTPELGPETCGTNDFCVEVLYI